MTVSPHLSRGDNAILRFLRAYLLEHGFSPSIREIAAGVGSPTAVGYTHSRVKHLVACGAIVQGVGQRALSLPASANVVTLDFPPEMDRQLRALALNAETTIEAIVIECVRDRLALLDRSDFVVVKQRKPLSASSSVSRSC